MRTIIFCVIFFYFLTLLQIDFFVHFSVFGIVPNFVLAAIILPCLFARFLFWQAMAAAFIGGFFLDIFSLNPAGFFGFYTLISALAALLVKFIIKEYVRFPVVKKF